MACVWVVAVEAQVAGAGVAGQPGREVVDEFAHCDGYGSGEMVVIGEGEQAGPGVEVGADRRDVEPGLVQCQELGG